MKNQITKYLIPLAALTLVTVACDPFPAKPGGDPAVVRVIAYGGHSSTQETKTAAGQFVIDDAWPDDAIRIHFNKPMDGSSIQADAQYNPDGTTKVDAAGDFLPCTKAPGIILSSNFPANTPVCYDPASPTDGGALYIPSPHVEWMVYGQVYTITGSVKDYEGKPVTLNVAVSIDQRPLPFARTTDGYSASLDWFDSGIATAYEVLSSTDGTNYTTLFNIDPAVDCDGIYCAPYATGKYHTHLVPSTEYWYQVKETNATGTITRPAVAGPITTAKPLIPSFGVVTTTTAPITVIKGVIKVSWGNVRAVTGYTLEQAPDVNGAPGTWTTLPTTGTTTSFIAGGPAPVPPAVGTLTSGATYWFRVTPAFATGAPVGYVPVPGRAAAITVP